MRMNNRYDEIINLPHHVSKTRPQMPMSDRAAQFAPFAALTGYESAIKETGRLTDEKIELDEESLTALDMKYQLLMEALDDAPEVTITYFQPDERKAGGKYITATGAVKKVDDFERDAAYRWVRIGKNVLMRTSIPERTGESNENNHRKRDRQCLRKTGLHHPIPEH